IASGAWDLVCYGHTHVAELHRAGRTLVLNPGALFRASPHTLAVVDLVTLTARHIPVEGSLQPGSPPLLPWQPGHRNLTIARPQGLPAVHGCPSIRARFEAEPRQQCVFGRARERAPHAGLHEFINYCHEHQTRPTD